MVYMVCSRLYAVSTALMVVAGSSSCAYLHSSRAPLAAEVLVERPQAECVLVFLPGIGDSPELFKQYGFDAAVKAGDARCEMLTVNGDFAYYRDAVFPQRLADEWLTPLRKRYTRIWLVGVSLGGYGAVQTARAHPELVDGVVLISPFLGVPKGTKALVDRIDAEGGLENFHSTAAAPKNPRRHFMEPEPVWDWLAARSRGEPGPALIMAWGDADQFVVAQRTVGRALPEDTTFTTEGGHTWTTFASLWRQVAATTPWNL